MTVTQDTIIVEFTSMCTLLVIVHGPGNFIVMSIYRKVLVVAHVALSLI